MSQKLILIIVAVSSLILIWLGTIPPTEIPEVNPEVVPEPQDYTISLGYIATTQSNLPQDEFLIHLAEDDINDYCLSNDIPWRFHFIVKCAEG